jgi:hypothetical protein
MGPSEIPLDVISFENLNLEISKGRGLVAGEDLEIVLSGYSVYHEDELRW